MPPTQQPLERCQNQVYPVYLVKTIRIKDFYRLSIEERAELPMDQQEPCLQGG